MKRAAGQTFQGCKRDEVIMRELLFPQITEFTNQYGRN
jgi:hypothetical protein